MANGVTYRVAKDKTVVKLPVANNALLEAPIYESHRRGSNWLAVIDVDATMPGGLSRRWAPRGKGDCLYMVEQVALFDPVEFAADYTTSVGDKRQNRWHGVVVAKTEEFLLVEKCPSGVKAVLRAKEARASGKEKLDALEVERRAALAKAERLQAEIDEISRAGEQKVSGVW